MDGHPKFRYILHNQLGKKLKKIAAWEEIAPICLNPSVQSDKAIVLSGVSAAHARDTCQGLVIDEDFYGYSHFFNP